MADRAYTAPVGLHTDTESCYVDSSDSFSTELSGYNVTSLVNGTYCGKVEYQAVAAHQEQQCREHQK